MNRRQLVLITITVLIPMVMYSYAGGQTATPSVFASGFRAPVKSLFTPKGNLLVAEAGNGPNTGRISIVEASGNRRTLIDGLPSGLAPPNMDPSGPAGLALRGRQLFIVIGAGDGTLPGPFPATEMINPNPSSPFLSSVLKFRLSQQIEDTTQGFTLTLSDQASIENRGFAKLADSVGNELTLEVLIDFPNYTYDRPRIPSGYQYGKESCTSSTQPRIGYGKLIAIPARSEAFSSSALSQTRSFRPWDHRSSTWCLTAFE
jgi:hypothetical protein